MLLHLYYILLQYSRTHPRNTIAESERYDIIEVVSMSNVAENW